MIRLIWPLISFASIDRDIDLRERNMDTGMNATTIGYSQADGTYLANLGRVGKTHGEWRLPDQQFSGPVLTSEPKKR